MDPQTGVSKGYGFIRFSNQDEVNHALFHMQGQFIGKSPIKLFISSKSETIGQRQLAPNDPNDPNNTTLYIAGIDNIDEMEVERCFQVFGKIVYVKIPTGKKCAFVQFLNRMDAENAMREMNGAVIANHRVRVLWGRSNNPNVKKSSTFEEKKGSLQQQPQGFQQQVQQQIQQPQIQKPLIDEKKIMEQQQQAYNHYMNQLKLYQIQQQKMLKKQQQMEQYLNYNVEKENESFISKQHFTSLTTKSILKIMK